MMNGVPSKAVILTLDGSPIMFWYIYRKNMHAVFNVFKMLCTFYLVIKQNLSSSSSQSLVVKSGTLKLSPGQGTKPALSQ